MVIGISSLFIVASIVRLTNLYPESLKIMSLWYLSRYKTVRILQGASSFAEQPKVLAFAILIIKIFNLVLWVHIPELRYSVAAASMTLAGAIVLTVLVPLEHHRSKRPSSIISVYLIAQIVADSYVLRTLKLRHYPYAPVFVGTSWANIFTQLALLALESTSKRSNLKSPVDDGLKEITGIFDRNTVWWLTKLFWKGNRSVLSQSDLLPLDGELKTQRLRDQVVLVWDKSMISNFPSVTELTFQQRGFIKTHCS
jgi:ATP-binding cassette, subfamily C (CFTR/MRP), member 1